MTLLRKLIRSQSGAAMVEFAVVLPFLALLTIGLIEVGRYTYFGILAAHAAEAAAQFGSQSLATSTNNSGMTAAANGDASGATWIVSPIQYCPKSGSTVTACAAGSTYYVKVVVSGVFHPLLRYPGIPNVLNVSASSIMRVALQ